MHVITLLLIEWEFISIINCTCYSVTYMGTRPLNKGTNRPITLCTVKLFIQLMYNKNDHLAKWSIFCQIFDVFFRLYNPFAPLDPRRPLHMLCICIATFSCPKGILGLGGQSIQKQTERRQFHLFNDKRHNFKYISYACAEEKPQSFENEGYLYP